MKKSSNQHIRELILRISRLHAADEWTDELNPTQRAALFYLSRANRFSRTPSHVADFLSATRGTVSQTLKSLEKKGMIELGHSATDRRSIFYLTTAKGIEVLKHSTTIDASLEQLPTATRTMLSQSLEALIRVTLTMRGNKQFGMCKDCQHHKKRDRGGFCSLLNEPLEPPEVDQICHEYSEVI